MADRDGTDAGPGPESGAGADSGPGSGAPPRPGRSRRRRLADAAAWGAVGALVFLGLHQAYLLVGGQFLGVVPVGGVALAVWAGTTAAAAVLARRRGPRPGSGPGDRPGGE